MCLMKIYVKTNVFLSFQDLFVDDDEEDDDDDDDDEDDDDWTSLTKKMCHHHEYIVIKFMWLNLDLYLIYMCSFTVITSIYLIESRIHV